MILLSVEVDFSILVLSKQAILIILYKVLVRSFLVMMIMTELRKDNWIVPSIRNYQNAFPGISHNHHD